jgi:hypothetical protein
MPLDLQPHRRFPGSLGPEDDRRRWFGWVSVHFVPNGMVRTADTVLFEDRVRLRIFFRKGIAEDAMVFQKALYVHLARLALR